MSYAALQGYVSMEVRFKGKGGHSSLPPADGSQVGMHILPMDSTRHELLHASLTPLCQEAFWLCISCVLPHCNSWNLEKITNELVGSLKSSREAGSQAGNTQAASASASLYSSRQVTSIPPSCASA